MCSSLSIFNLKYSQKTMVALEEGEGHRMIAPGFYSFSGIFLKGKCHQFGRPLVRPLLSFSTTKRFGGQKKSNLNSIKDKKIAIVDPRDNRRHRNFFVVQQHFNNGLVFHVENSSFLK